MSWPSISTASHSKASNFARTSLSVHDLLGGAVGLEVVVVDDRGQVGDAEVRGRHRAPPRSGPPGSRRRTAARTRARRRSRRGAAPSAMPERHRQPLPERAGRDLDARACGSCPGGPGGARRACAGPSGPRAGSSRAGRAPRTGSAPRGPCESTKRSRPGQSRPLGVVAQHPVVERGDDVGRRQRAVEVAGLGDRQHPHAVDAQHASRGRSSSAMSSASRRSAPLAAARLSLCHRPAGPPSELRRPLPALAAASWLRANDGSSGCPGHATDGRLRCPSAGRIASTCRPALQARLQCTWTLPAEAQRADRRERARASAWSRSRPIRRSRRRRASMLDRGVTALAVIDVDSARPRDHHRGRPRPCDGRARPTHAGSWCATT